MRTEKEIRGRLAEVVADEHLNNCPPAPVTVNPDLALIQVMLESEAQTLRWVLGEFP